MTFTTGVLKILPSASKRLAKTRQFSEKIRQINFFRSGSVKKPLLPGTVASRLVLVSSWRSGSSFLSELLASHPGSLLQTEPLTTLGIKRIFNVYDQDAYAAYDIVSNILKCNNSALKGT